MSADLFHDPERAKAFMPLASRLRPKKLEHYVGQDHLLGEGSVLGASIRQGQLHSMLFWGPPGVGKTTLAKMMAGYADAQYLELSAVMSGVKDIRQAVDKAIQHRQQFSKPTLLFIDEIHRYSKSQQDALLPHIESGDFIFIGATTENPSFELNAALLSRCRVYVLKALDEPAIKQLIVRALAEDDLLAKRQVEITDEALDLLTQAASGDARRALTLLELATELLKSNQAQIDLSIIKQASLQSFRRFDKGGERFYDQISAMHKSIRGSDPDAALYWLCRMLDGGCDPLYLARRLVRTASEDIGNADPRALQLAMNAWDVQERLGSPEGELALAQATVYLAVAAKSNAVYVAFNDCMKAIREGADEEVPMHIRNAPTTLMKELDYGKGYRYPHDEPHAVAAGVIYLPEALEGQRFYHPVDRGLEKQISEKLSFIAGLNEKAKNKN